MIKIPAAFTLANSSLNASIFSSNVRFLFSASLYDSCMDLSLASFCDIFNRLSASSFS